MPITVMIVEDNQLLAESIRAFFVKKNEAEITCIASSSLEAIEMMKVSNPNVIILDLVMPRSDGFVLLEHLNTFRDENRPEVIILSSLSHESIIKRACDLGAVYYMVKPFTMEDLHKRVISIAGFKKPPQQHVQPPRPDKSIDQYLSKILAEFGIPPKNRGYKYICEAVKMVIVNPELIDSITKHLYPTIARMYTSSSANVECAIRRAIMIACDSERLQSIDKALDIHSPPLRYRPSNGEFISLISSRVLNCITEKTKSPQDRNS